MFAPGDLGNSPSSFCIRIEFLGFVNLRSVNPDEADPLAIFQEERIAVNDALYLPGLEISGLRKKEIDSNRETSESR